MAFRPHPVAMQSDCPGWVETGGEFGSGKQTTSTASLIWTGRSNLKTAWSLKRAVESKSGWDATAATFTTCSLGLKPPITWRPTFTWRSDGGVLDTKVTSNPNEVTTLG